MKPTKLRQALEGKLTSKELQHLKGSFDVVGDIIILEVPKELHHKQAIIGNTLLRMHRNAKVVCRRAGMHTGKFRTQKLKVIAGEKRTVTTHRENGVALSLDVQEVYFSARSGTERLRIAKQVKKGESVLVMFSGCAPFLCVIAKNTQAKEIFGIELNPSGHYYGQQNIRENKIHNATTILGDVRKIVPNFYQYIIGLKSSIDDGEMIKRLQKNPGIVELHLFNKDLFLKSRFKKIQSRIRSLQKKGIEVIIHQPFSYKDGSPFNFGKKNLTIEWDLVRQLSKLCKEFKVKAVVHPYTVPAIPESSQTLVHNLRKLKRMFPYFMFENMTHPPWTSAKTIVNLGRKAGIENVVVDLAHFMIMKKSTGGLIQEIQLLQKHFNTYFHVSDSDTKDQAMVIGKGKIDFSKVLPLINKGVIEVRSKDEYHPKEMLKSYSKIAKLHKTFDRIIMPLPKDAEKFLDVALLASKKGTIIHFYDFWREDEFNKGKKKVLDLCKKYKTKVKILKVVKCGSYSPQVHRVCIDLKVI